jgi:hypothetical protein
MIKMKKVLKKRVLVQEDTRTYKLCFPKPQGQTKIATSKIKLLIMVTEETLKIYLVPNKEQEEV